MQIDDHTLLAYLDGQLEEAQYEPVEQALAHDATLRERLQALVDSGEQVQRAFDAKLQEAVPAHLVQAIMQAPLNTNAEAAPAPATRHAPPTGWWAHTRAALWPAPAPGAWGRAAFASVAVLALGVWLGQSLQNADPDSGTTLAQGQAVPDAGLAAALELAPSGRRLHTPHGHVEVLATFVQANGAVCREFERQHQQQVDAGIACRLPVAAGGDNGTWQVSMVASETRAADTFQTASDALHEAVNRHIDARFANGALDPQAERAWLDKAWTR